MGESLRLCPDLVAERLSPPGVIEETDVPGPQVAGHSLRVAEIGERPGEHHPVEAGEDSTNLVGVTFDEGWHNAGESTSERHQTPTVL